MTYTRPSHNSPAADSSATDLTVILDALSDGLERVEAAAFNVKAYGATGDGSTDDSSAIQSAVDAFTATGGTLFFPPGTYVLGTAITVDAPIQFLGAGGWPDTAFDAYSVAPVSHIKVNSTTQSAFVVSAHGCQFRNLGIINWMTASTVTAGRGIDFQYGNRSIVSDCWIEGFYDNIYYERSDGATVRDSFIRNPWRAAIRIKNQDNNDEGAHLISGNTIDVYGSDLTRTVPYGILWESGGGTRILGNYFNGKSGSQFTTNIGIIPLPASTTGVIRIQNNSIENYATYGIYMAPASGSDTWSMQGIYISGNEFGKYSGSGATAMWIYGGTNATIQQVAINDNDVIHGDIGVAADYWTSGRIDNNSFRDQLTTAGIVLGANMRGLPSIGRNSYYYAGSSDNVAFQNNLARTSTAERHQSTPIQLGGDTSFLTNWTDLFIVGNASYDACRFTVDLEGVFTNVGGVAATQSWFVHRLGTPTTTTTTDVAALVRSTACVEFQWSISGSNATLQARCTGSATAFAGTMRYRIEGYPLRLTMKHASGV